jgi:signal transduction histidine kinase
VQQALLALAEELMSRTDGRRGASSVDAAARPGDGPPGSGARLRQVRHDRIARRIAGRVDAALVALRLAAHSVARLSESSGSDEDVQRVNDAARRVLGASDQAGIAGAAALEPLRAALVEELGLSGALQELLHACSLAHPECTFDLQGSADAADLEPSIAAAAHRAVQDVLVHLVAYSDATHVVVRPETGAAAQVRVVVAHDGETEVSNAAQAHLAQVRDAIVSAGGLLEVETSPALLTLVMPRARPSEA